MNHAGFDLGIGHNGGNLRGDIVHPAVPGPWKNEWSLGEPFLQGKGVSIR